MAVKKNILANYIGQATTSLLGIVFVPVYISYLSIEAYGLVGLFAVIQVWMSLLDLGMTPTLAREMALFKSDAKGTQTIRDLLRSLEIVFIGLAVTITLSIALAAPYLATNWVNRGHLSQSTVTHALTIMSLVIGMRFLEGIYRSALIGLQQQVWFNSASVALAGLRTAGAIAILALVSPTIEAFFIWQGVISLLTIGLFAAKVHFSLPAAPRPARFSVSVLISIRRFAGGMFVLALLSVMLTQVDKLLLSRLLPLGQFGAYMLASTVTGSIYLLLGPITQAIYPAFTRLVSTGDERRLSLRYHEASQLVSLLLVPAVSLLAVYPKAILFVWSNNASLADQTGPILALLAIGTYLNGLMHVPHQIQLAYAWTSLSIRSNILAIAVLLPALFWSVPIYGATAAATIWLALNAGYIVLQMPVMHRTVLPGELQKWYINDVGFPILGALIVIIPAFFMRRDALGNRFEWLVFLSVVGSLTFISSLLLTATVRRRLISALKVVHERGIIKRA
jgi:O-antigen/teichoic acid export membrane protein